jgi:hypothetical protein
VIGVSCNAANFHDPCCFTHTLIYRARASTFCPLITPRICARSRHDRCVVVNRHALIVDIDRRQVDINRAGTSKLLFSIRDCLPTTGDSKERKLSDSPTTSYVRICCIFFFLSFSISGHSAGMRRNIHAEGTRGSGHTSQFCLTRDRKEKCGSKTWLRFDPNASSVPFHNFLRRR